jgi:hypothetical protein
LHCDPGIPQTSNKNYGLEWSKNHWRGQAHPSRWLPAHPAAQTDSQHTQLSLTFPPWPVGFARRWKGSLGPLPL